MEWRNLLLIGGAFLGAIGYGLAGAQQATEPRSVDAAPTDEAPAEEAEDSQPADAAEGTEASQDNASVEPTDSDAQPRKVAWDEQIEGVLTKRYPESVADLKLIQTQTQRVVEHAMPAVVAVQVGGAFGSAVIVSPDGMVLTAGHVVGRPGLPVTFIFADGSTAKGETLGIYREIDSGMMKITDPGPWPFVEMAEAEKPKAGKWVVAIGQPGGFDRERTPPVRLGRVLFANDEVISTDCTLVGGDSGGPLFNMRGQVMGIHSRIGRRITDNFHVPISTYHNTWDRLVAGESWGGPLGSDEVADSRPLLGVTGRRGGSECKLTEVFPGMPAHRAGLKVGDIVKEFNGEPVNTFDDLVRMVYGLEPRNEVKIRVLRGDETMDVKLRLGGVRQPLPGSAEKPKRKESKPKKGGQ